MGKYKANITSIYTLITEIESAELKLIYFLFGEDNFTINKAIRALTKKVEPILSSDFDKEVVAAEKKDNLSNLMDLAYTFPFASEKKLLVVKNFENYNNKKQFTKYIDDPNESTILVIANYGSLNSFNAEPYKSLGAKSYLFEERAGELDFKIEQENVKSLVEIVGEDKSLLEMQLQKFKIFLGNDREIKISDIQKLSAVTKEYSIFDLLNSVGKGNISNSIKVVFNLLNNGKDLVFIITMLTKYFSVISQSLELQQRRLSDFDASKAIGVSKYYYINCKKASYFKDDHKLKQAIKALYKADLALKTTGVDQKTLSSIMLTEIFLHKNNYSEIN